MLAERGFECFRDLTDQTTGFFFVECPDGRNTGDSGREHVFGISFIDPTKSKELIGYIIVRISRSR